MLARNERRLDQLEQELPGSKGYVCDVTDAKAIDETIAKVRSELGDPEILVHNAVMGLRGSYADLDPEVFKQMFDINVVSLLRLAQRLTPAMLAAGRGAIVVTGNTAALRGGPNHAAFAPTKAAQRILSEHLARNLGPKGIHVAYVVIDAVVDMPRMRQRHPNEGDDFFIQPTAIAEEIWHIAHQDRCAWSFNVELRPFREKW
jgi:NADP-dependent 3-hydroxy acid dehydrogenase YdfG